MGKRLQLPDSWQEFENLCTELWKSIWCDSNTKRNGRQGQEQHGVDIWGCPIYSKEYSGIQCKYKDDLNNGSNLTEQELEDEAKKAKNFIPKLGEFILATTSASDAKIQQKCREMTQSKDYPFSIDVWSWTDISTEIQCRPDVLAAFYQDQPIDQNNLNEMHLGRLDNLGRIMCFLSRDNIKLSFSKSVLSLLYKLLGEFTLNAFEHGEATEVRFQYINPDTLVFSDNGKAFNQVQNLMDQGRGGSMTLKVANDNFSIKEPWIFYDYSRELGNTIKIVLEEVVRKKALNPVEIEFPESNNVHSYDSGLSQAYKNIEEVKKLGVNVNILIKSTGLISGVYGYLDTMSGALKDNIECVSLPNNTTSDKYVEICKKLDLKCKIR